MKRRKKGESKIMVKISINWNSILNSKYRFIENWMNESNRLFMADVTPDKVEISIDAHSRPHEISGRTPVGFDRDEVWTGIPQK